MDIGKLPNKVLEDLVISSIKNRREEVIERAAVGKDCAIIDYGDKYCVLSSDPITGAEKNLGKIAVNVACNDIAAGGAEPVALLITILAPPETTQETIRNIMSEANEASSEINVEIVGGHTEITNAVNRIVLSMTAVGIKDKKNVLEDVREGDCVLMTKLSGMEGSTIIAEEKEEELLKAGFTPKELGEAKDYLNYLSVVKEGTICASVGVKYMHDITEGGVEGAVWEASKALGMGIEINEDEIPVADVTKKLCRYFSIDYLKLISSGSMLVISSKENLGPIKEKLELNGIAVTMIGEIKGEKVSFISDGKSREVNQPESDELYKVV
ncbi:hydrogenase expression/formation protein HypE [Dethiosulfatibacter aminovorans DSM 17477]|uniref:Hydrogenase expression/formation protein HypE n=1 Tax=Dethiosulfatibacter aminovorans DSM 17477 TaxID=1121476 RepID=A0A1M6FWL3_9FIRM|nr:AIR synthase family protein [Dethiosulfatibacter aminovorans]SHJ02108.1 hydrogenase expression/formation protein HypE [Dethiosulfatibacter aminovorans DSM 17477]